MTDEDAMASVCGGCGCNVIGGDCPVCNRVEPVFDTFWVLTQSNEDHMEGICGIFRSESSARTAMYDRAVDHGYTGERDDHSTEVSAPGLNTSVHLMIEEFSVKD